MAMSQGWGGLRVVVLATLLGACGGDSPMADSGPEDGSPDSMMDAAVPDARADADADPGDGDLPDGDLPDGDLPDGDLPDGDVPDGDVPDGDVPDGDMPDGDVPDGDVPDGDVPDADVPDVAPTIYDLDLTLTGMGEVQLLLMGDSCSSSCTRSFTDGTGVALSAVPAAGYAFGGWTDDCSGSAGAGCAVTMDADRTVGAIFTPTTDGLTVVLAGTGSGAVVSTPAAIDCPGTCAASLTSGTALALVATPAAGSDFEGWSGACAGLADCDLTVSAPTVAVASFRVRRYTLDVALSGDGLGGVAADVGAIDCGSTCDDDYDHGDVVTLTASADVSSTFTGWTGACAAAGSSPTCMVMMTEAASVAAAFTKRRFDIDVTVGGVGTGSVSAPAAGITCGATCTANVAYGTMVTFTANAGTGSDISTWGGACSGGAGTCALTITADTSVNVDFAVRMYAVNVTRAELRGGTGSVSSMPAGISCGATCSMMVAHGTVVTLAAAPAAGSQHLGWSTGDGSCLGTGDCVVTVVANRSITATFAGQTPVYLSETDRDPDIRLRWDLLGADLHDAFGGVRSDTAISPGSGVFYVEGHRTTARLGPYGMAVASGLLDVNNGTCGLTDQAFGFHVNGGVTYNSAYAGGFDSTATEWYGMVVDYRGATPTVYLLLHDMNWVSGMVEAMVANVQEMPAVTTDVYFMACGMRQIVGSEIEVNPGNDTTNFPFHYDADALLRAAGHGGVADALVMGWGSTYAGSANDLPVITPSVDRVVAAGTPVMLTASALDAEDGDLSTSIRWDLESSPYYLGRVEGSGTSFSFTPTEVGIHPVRAWVVDSIGQVGTRTIMVEVSDPLPQYDPVALVPDALTGVGIDVRGDNLGARWTGSGKNGIRANQGIYGQFWYFEMTRHIPIINMGGGLVVSYGDLNPYDWDNVPQSMSINVVGGTWWNLIPRVSLPGTGSDHSTYGYAVDYRGPDPVVYVVVDAIVADTLLMDDVTTPLYPFMYGNATGTTAGSYDESFNFGTSAFVQDPVTALTAAGVEMTGFELGWGDANTP